jgi:hypothetical protein
MVGGTALAIAGLAGYDWRIAAVALGIWLIVNGIRLSRVPPEQPKEGGERT